MPTNAYPSDHALLKSTAAFLDVFLKEDNGTCNCESDVLARKLRVEINDRLDWLRKCDEEDRADNVLANIQVGDRVVALTLVDPEGANVQPGGIGEVIRLAGESPDGYSEPSPFVEWDDAGRCNIYPGDVAVLDRDAVEDARRLSE